MLGGSLPTSKFTLHIWELTLSKTLTQEKPSAEFCSSPNSFLCCEVRFCELQFLTTSDSCILTSAFWIPRDYYLPPCSFIAHRPPKTKSKRIEFNWVVILLLKIMVLKHCCSKYYFLESNLFFSCSHPQ